MPDQLQGQIAALIDGALRHEDITRAELARRMQVTPSYVTSMLSGRRRMTMTFLAQVLQVLNYRVVLVPGETSGSVVDLGSED
jgi:transcriptional regulator with XRE-family HTH domain